MDALSHTDPIDRRMPLPGDDRLGDTKVQITHEISIDGTPAEIWPHLLDMVQSEAASVDDRHTVLRARARVAHTFDAVQWSAVWLYPFNDFIDNEDLHRLKVRVEGHSS